MKRHSTSWNIRYTLNIYARFSMLGVFLRLYEVSAFPNNQLKRHRESGQGTGTREEGGQKRHACTRSFKTLGVFFVHCVCFLERQSKR